MLLATLALINHNYCLICAGPIHESAFTFELVPAAEPQEWDAEQGARPPGAEGTITRKKLRMAAHASALALADADGQPSSTLVVQTGGYVLSPYHLWGKPGTRRGR